MLLSAEQLVEHIHDSPTHIVLAVTGGGSRAIADLLAVPGGSRTLLEAVVPYSASAMAVWLGSQPDDFCSAATARAMAMVAFQRGRRYEEPEKMPAGVACSASLTTDRPKRGPHRIHVALQTAAVTTVWWLQLHKDRRSRAEEERLAGRLVLNVVAEACDVPERLVLELLEGEQVQESRTEALPEWQDLLLDKVESVCIGPTGRAPKIIMSGAFNPLHVGHRRMIQIAHELLHEPVALDLSIVNVDKPPLDYVELKRRLGQFPPEQTVYLTRAATFEEKSRLFPGATFVVGADTLRRIVAPQYYGGSAVACQHVLERIASRGCRFLVFGRDLGKGFVRLADLDLPASLRALCREVPPDVFCEESSSTAIRKSGAW
jgi:nicotinamide mononucleotide (NMN) deamidase PncC